MRPVGKHSDEAVSTPSAPKVSTYALAVLLTALAWAVLVYYAIRLGPDAKAGEVRAWVLLVVATLGAIGCLFLSMMLGSRLVELVRGRPAPAKLPGGRHGKH